MRFVVPLTDPSAQSRAVVGGKGANLARLAAAFPVPAGVVVNTDAYAEFADAPAVAEKLWPLVDGIDYDDADAVERDTAAIRELLTSAEVPAALEAEIVSAYEELTAAETGYVAVRSSGTAEDTAEASFAGLHDTYLDINGPEQVVDAVKRCWASLWSARAVAYRRKNDFDHREAKLAVVVQTMVDADAAGVAFTANPMTGATREIVVNSSWGLGEAVVSGIVTPDEFVVDSDTLATRSETLGDKAVEIVRDPDTGSGTITRDLEGARRSEPSLDAAALRDLAQLALKVQEHYDGMPQDIEWARRGEDLFLLQSRDVTGVELSWDEDIDNWQTLRDSDDFVWTRAYSDEYWTGAITPLFYSVRAREYSDVHHRAMQTFGYHDLAEDRIWKYSKAEAYFSSTYDREFNQRTIPPFLRSPGVLAKTPSTWWDEILEAPFSWLDYTKMHARIFALEPKMGPQKWIDLVYEYIEGDYHHQIHKDPEELANYSDEGLERLIYEQIRYFTDFLYFFWGGFFIYAPTELTLVGDLLGRWYDGDNPQVFTDLITGLPKQTITLKENVELSRLAGLIRESDELRSIFDEHPDNDFFDEVRRRESTKEFAAAYDAFVAEHGHRGHEDRDFWFLRRAEAPYQDYRAMKAILSVDADAPSPEEQEAAMRKRREDATEEVLANIRAKTFGSAKAEAFKFLLKHTYQFLVVRDDERHFIDRLTWAKKLTLMEVGNRLADRGLLERHEDMYFLSLEENFELLFGRAGERLTKAKIAGRRAHFDRFDKREVTPPKYIVAGRPEELDVGAEEGEDGSLQGIGTSRGSITGRARVLRSMTEIGSLEKGDILICNSTDPGWTPAFLTIGGLVLETGGMLAHGSCLSREYGLPAVQIANATNLIDDGTTITVDGDSGAVAVAENGAGANGAGGGDE
jgi:rifampicin phosphotransferase